MCARKSSSSRISRGNRRALLKIIIRNNARERDHPLDVDDVWKMLVVNRFILFFQTLIKNIFKRSVIIENRKIKKKKFKNTLFLKKKKTYD